MTTNQTTKQSTARTKDKALIDDVKAYLYEIGRVPLLDHHEELEYGKQIQKMLSLLNAKNKLTGSTESEPSAQEWAVSVGLTVTELNQQLRQGKRAKDKMVAANLRLVVSIAKKYQNQGLEFLDLVQEGTLGLTRAAEKFDPIRGFKFSTYATWWIRQAVTRAIADQGRIIRLPIHMTEKQNKIRKAAKTLAQELKRHPTTEEIAEHLECTVDQVRAAIDASKTVDSLDRRVGKDEESSLMDFLADESNTEDYAEQQEAKDTLEALLGTLTPREREILELRNGLYGGKGMSLEAIGNRFNITRERVRQIEKKAMGKLRNKARTKINPL